VAGTGGRDGGGGTQSGGNGGVGAGGAGAGGIGTGGIGAGGISSGGSPSQTIEEPCETLEQANSSLDPEERERTIGDNGTFEDTCAADGNLIEYVCETQIVCEGAPNPACTTLLTGNATEQVLNCSGHCVDGTCEARCPAVGDVIRYLSVDASGNPELSNVTDGRQYSCDLIFDAGGCTSIVADTERVITSLGLRGGPCTGADFGNIGTSDPQQCSYRCDITP
jgi:hypothetical protein